MTDAEILTHAIEADAVALAGIPAPTGSEGERLAWLEDRLASATGARSRDSAGNLVWALGELPPALALLAHVDTVFAADVAHTVSEQNGWLCGPGIGDNALAVAVALNVVGPRPRTSTESCNLRVCRRRATCRGTFARLCIDSSERPQHGSDLRSPSPSRCS